MKLDQECISKGLKGDILIAYQELIQIELDILENEYQLLQKANS